MKTTTTRTATAEERARLEAHLNPKGKGKPAWIAAVMVALPATFALFVLLNLLLPGVVPALVRLLLAVGIGGGAAWFYGKRATARYGEAFRPAPEVQELLRKDLDGGAVVVARYETEAVVKVVADRPSFVGATWFVKLGDGAVALLVQPELEEAAFHGEFPATSFEIASGEASHFVLSVRRTGEKLAPAKTRSPLSDEEWEELGEEADAPVPFGWEEVLARADRNPLSRRARAEEAPA